MTRRLAGFEKRRIAALLPLCKGADLPFVFKEIEAALENFRHDMDASLAARYKEPEFRKSRPGEVIDGEVSNGSSRLVILRTEGRGLKVSARTGVLASPGRIRKTALRNYIKALVMIHRRATGTWIKRWRDHSPDKHELPVPFLAYCIWIAGVVRDKLGPGDKRFPLMRGYPYAIVKGVLHELNPHDRQGRPPGSA